MAMLIYTEFGDVAATPRVLSPATKGSVAMTKENCKKKIVQQHCLVRISLDT